MPHRRTPLMTTTNPLCSRRSGKARSTVFSRRRNTFWSSMMSLSTCFIPFHLLFAIWPQRYIFISIQNRINGTLTLFVIETTHFVTIVLRSLELSRLFRRSQERYRFRPPSFVLRPSLSFNPEPCSRLCHLARPRRFSSTLVNH